MKQKLTEMQIRVFIASLSSSPCGRRALQNLRAMLLDDACSLDSEKSLQLILLLAEALGGCPDCLVSSLDEVLS